VIGNSVNSPTISQRLPNELGGVGGPVAIVVTCDRHQLASSQSEYRRVPEAKPLEIHAETTVNDGWIIDCSVVVRPWSESTA
jgi:hypothetical protein